MRHEESLLRELYTAFDNRVVEEALGLLHPQVDWPDLIDHDRLNGREAVHAYWNRRFANTAMTMTPTHFHFEPDGRVAVTVDQVLRDLAGDLLSERKVTHTYSFKDGLVARMDISHG
ncbi:ketosteroid isomerase [Caulobacter sp. CCUG 60055]|uniref:nuclear transport factor 2 family protein n=1 Tax=Caulobacter sp. CCUG 60055 TaxID=2100090 RepID=UPI001FA7BF47|nr:nuclear transport factor 2 family protein [Caulobacter sp. CCUG 60055]MCI3181200.1 ketosteroid isomerase [Caulobacter sp. CCUG 60055]